MNRRSIHIKQIQDYDAMEKLGPRRAASEAFQRPAYPTISVAEYIKKIRGVCNAAPD